MAHTPALMVGSGIAGPTARVNSNKAATGVVRVMRDMMMPLFLTLMANSGQQRQLYGYHIEWGAPA